MITRTDVLAHLERSARVGFLTGAKKYQPLRGAFANEPKSDGAFEIYTDMGATPWPVRNGGQTSATTDARTGQPQSGGIHEGGPVTVLGGNERGLVVYNQDWQVSIGIHHNAINDNRIGGLEEWAMNAGLRFEQHKDYLCFDALNSGEATTNYGPSYDGLSFFNDSHVDRGAEYTTAQDNRFAVALTPDTALDSFETVRIAASKFKDDRGIPVGYSHNLIIHAVDLERAVAQIVSNPTDAGTGNRASNPYAGKMKSLAAPGGWLDTTAWYLVDDNQISKPVILQMREAAQLVYWDDHTQGNGIRYYKWIARYVATYGDWRLCAQGNS